MIARKHLEFLKNADLDAVAKKAAWCADYISELLETIDEDIILKTNVSRESVIEVRANQRPTKAGEIDVLIEMLQLTKSAFDRVEPAEIEPKRERDDN